MDLSLPSFEKTVVDAEIDLLARGGIQRFPTVESIDVWIAEEEAFWQWLRHGNASQIFMGASQEQWNQFWSYKDTIAALRNREFQQWNATIEAIKNLQSPDSSGTSDEGSAISEQIRGRLESANKIVRDYANSAVATLKSQIEAWYHVSRFEPVAQFISEVAKKQPGAAAYALDHVISKGRNNYSRQQDEFNGRLAASLFADNLVDGKEANNSAFAESAATWGRELSDYKGRFDGLLASYKELEESCIATNHEWKSHESAMKVADETRLAEFDKSLESRLAQNGVQMSLLKDVYEKHMQLQGPLIYWRGKRREHEALIKRLRLWLVASSGVGLLIIWLAAYQLLPDYHPEGTIPWRPIGLFLILSTFVIWFIKLLIKIFLSNIHLAADAAERVVMISTFMALQRKRNSKSESNPLDMTIIMSSIFRPSTSGVITDDGGPVTVTDMLSRLAGGKG